MTPSSNHTHHVALLEGTTTRGTLTNCIFFFLCEKLYIELEVAGALHQIHGSLSIPLTSKQPNHNTLEIGGIWFRRRDRMEWDDDPTVVSVRLGRLRQSHHY